MDARQGLGRVLEAPELCQKLTHWLLGSGEVGKEEQSEIFQYFNNVSSIVPGLFVCFTH